MRRVHFSGLTEIRGIAALAVILHHVELFKSREHLPSLFDTYFRLFIDNLGKNGVYLFFVLSGFLITFLLNEEKAHFSTIDVRRFYIRRVLRIWPLYYFITIFSFFAFPYIVTSFPDFFGSNYYFELVSKLDNNFFQKLLLFLMFLPNLALILYSPVAGASQSWSVGVEEQFYLLWPLMLNLVRKNTLNILFAVLIVKFLILGSFFMLMNVSTAPFLNVAFEFIGGLKIELMALGGIGAYFLRSGHIDRMAAMFNRKHVLVLLAIMLTGMVLAWNYFILSCFFLLFILVNTYDHLSIMKNRILFFFGEISYGLYMYHPICMFFAFCLSRYLIGTTDVVPFSILFYVLTIAFTIATSYVSYHFFEKKFLQMKNRFEIIKSSI